MNNFSETYYEEMARLERGQNHQSLIDRYGGSNGVQFARRLSSLRSTYSWMRPGTLLPLAAGGYDAGSPEARAAAEAEGNYLSAHRQRGDRVSSGLTRRERLARELKLPDSLLSSYEHLTDLVAKGGAGKSQIEAQKRLEATIREATGEGAPESVSGLTPLELAEFSARLDLYNKDPNKYREENAFSGQTTEDRLTSLGARYFDAQLEVAQRSIVGTKGRARGEARSRLADLRKQRKNFDQFGLYSAPVAKSGLMANAAALVSTDLGAVKDLVSYAVRPVSKPLGQAQGAALGALADVQVPTRLPTVGVGGVTASQGTPSFRLGDAAQKAQDALSTGTKAASRWTIAGVAAPIEMLSQTARLEAKQIQDEGFFGRSGLAGDSADNLADNLASIVGGTTLGQAAFGLETGQGSGLGAGYFPDMEGGAWKRRSYIERESGPLIGDHTWTPGRAVANLFTTPDTTAFNILSGITDASYQLAADPGIIAGRASTARKLEARGFTAAEDVAKSAGAVEGAVGGADVIAANIDAAKVGGWKRLTPWFRNKDVETYLSTDAGYKRLRTHMRDWDLYDINRAVKGQFPSVDHEGRPFLSALGEATTDQQLDDIMRRGLGTVVMDQPTSGGLTGVIRDEAKWKWRTKSNQSRVWRGVTPEAEYDIADEDVLFKNVSDRLDNANVPVEDWVETRKVPLTDKDTGEVLRDASGKVGHRTVETTHPGQRTTINALGAMLADPDINPKDRLFRITSHLAATEAAVAKANGMDAEVVDEIYELYKKHNKEERLFFMDAKGNRPVDPDLDWHLDVNGKKVVGYGPHLESELLGQRVIMPDYRTIRRMTSNPTMKWMMANKDAHPRIGLVIADEVMSVWKAGVLSRGALVVRIGGDEHARMAMEGFTSAFNKPFQHIAAVIGAGPDSRLKKIMQRIPHYGDAVVTPRRGTGARLLDENDRQVQKAIQADVIDMNPGQIVTSYGNEVVRRGSLKHPRAVLEELYRLHLDPMTEQTVFRYSNMDEAKEAFWKSDLWKQTKGWKPAIEDRAASDLWVERAYDRARIATMGPPVPEDVLGAGVSRRGVGEMVPIEEHGGKQFVQNADGSFKEVDVAALTKAPERIPTTTLDTYLDDILVSGKIDDIPVWDLERGQISKRAIAAMEKHLELTGSGPDVARVQKISTKRTTSKGLKGEGWWDAGTRRAMKIVLGDPTRIAARSPTLNQAYWRRMKRLAPFMSREARAEATTNAEGIAAKIWKNGATNEGKLTMAAADKIAMNYAVDDVTSLLYELAHRHQYWDILRLLAPFGEPWQEFFTVWGRIADPRALRRASQVVQEGQQNGLIYIDPKSGEQMFHYPGTPAQVGAITGAISGAFVGGMVGGYPGAAVGAAASGAFHAYAGAQASPVPGSVEFGGRLSGLNLAGNGLPGVGFGVQIPLTHLMADHPQLDVVADTLFPYGTRTKGDPVEEIFDAMFPSWANKYRRGIQIKLLGSNADVEQANLIMDFVAAEASSGKWDMSPGHVAESQAGMLKKAKNDAFWISMVQGAAAYSLPSAPQITIKGKDLDGKFVDLVVMAQDYYKLTNELGYDDGLAKFLDKWGDLNIFATARISQSNVAGLQPTREQRQWRGKHGGFVDKYPTVWALFAPQDGEFYGRAWDANLVSDDTSRISWQESTRIVNNTYGKLIYDYYRKQGWTADKLEKLHEDLVRDFDGYSDVDVNYDKTKNMITHLRDAVKDPRMKDNPAAIANREFLAEYDKAVREVRRNSDGDVRTLRNKTSGYLRRRLRRKAEELVSRYPEFEASYHRLWLSTVEWEPS